MINWPITLMVPPSYFGGALPPAVVTINDITYSILAWRDAFAPGRGPALQLALIQPQTVTEAELAFLAHARQVMIEALGAPNIERNEVTKVTKDAKLKFSVVHAVKLPRVEFGCDHSRERILVAQHGSKRVWRRPGFTGWAGVGMTDYYPATLEFENLGTDEHGPRARHLKEGGRLSRQLLRDCNVDELLGALVTQHWKPGYSVIVDDDHDV